MAAGSLDHHFAPTTAPALNLAVAFDPIASLRQEHAAIAALLELMKQEQALLVAAEVNGIPELTEQKAALISQISELAQQRHSALAAAGFDPNEENMQAWLAKINREDVAAAWRQLLDLTKSAKELNRVNGVLINKHLANNQNAINALQLPTQNENFYSPNGHATNLPKSRRLIIG